VIYKQKALAQMLKTLREGRVVAVMLDQNVQPGDGIFVRFFGRPACTTTVAAALAIKTGAPVVPAHCVRRADGRYRMVYGPPVEWTGTGRRDEDIKALTQQLTTVIEGWVRETPEQWLWLHRRWKRSHSHPSTPSRSRRISGSRQPRLPSLVPFQRRPVISSFASSSARRTGSETWCVAAALRDLVAPTGRAAEALRGLGGELYRAVSSGRRPREPWPAADVRPAGASTRALLPNCSRRPPRPGSPSAGDTRPTRAGCC
jgi:hypothetical protein